MLLKKATSLQLQLVIDIINDSKSYWQYDADFTSKYNKLFGLNKSYIEKNDVHIAYENNKILGCYSFVLEDNGQLKLDKFFLKPEFIAKGNGRKLWNSCIETAINYDVKEFTFTSDPNAERFYRQMGCEKIYQRPAFLVDNLNISIFKKQLPKKSNN